jgi:hypothetical protein
MIHSELGTKGSLLLNLFVRFASCCFFVKIIHRASRLTQWRGGGRIYPLPSYCFNTIHSFRLNLIVLTGLVLEGAKSEKIILILKMYIDLHSRVHQAN